METISEKDWERLLAMLDRRTRPTVVDLEYERKKRAAANCQHNRPLVSGPIGRNDQPDKLEE